MITSPTMKNPIKVAAVSGILLIILYFIFTLISFFISAEAKSSLTLALAQQVVITILSILFIYGFYSIGKKYKSSWLKGTAVYFILLSILSLVIITPLMVSFTNSLTASLSSEQGIRMTELTNSQSLTAEEQAELSTLSQQIFGPIIRLAIYAYIGMMLFLALPLILFGVGLIKLGNKVELANVTGILNIIAGAGAAILFGIFLLPVIFIFAIVLLFKEAKKWK